MDDKKREEIIKRYEELPEDVQRAYFSSATSDAIFEVGKKHGLVIEKMGELADETGLVMLGMTKPSEYIRNLEKRLGVEVTKAKEIAEDINQKVFSPIRESLKKIHGITSPPQPPSPSKGEGGEGGVTPISPIKPASLLDKEGVGGGITHPENLPVEQKSPLLDKEGRGEVFPPPLTVRGGGEGGGVTDKVNQILKNHEAIKQARKHVMPPQPEDVKVGEIVKPVESKVEVKPLFSGRIEDGSTPTPPISTKSTPKTTATDIPDIFIRNIPAESAPHNLAGKPNIIMPPPKPIENAPQMQTSKEVKNLLEKAANDPYKELPE